MIDKLFVYGTLSPNQPNEHILKKIDGSFKKATVRGKLIEKGWGAKMGCPGIKLDENANKIRGFVFESENLQNHWDMLDRFEGEEYERVVTKAQLENKSITETYIYILK